MANRIVSSISFDGKSFTFIFIDDKCYMRSAEALGATIFSDTFPPPDLNVKWQESGAPVDTGILRSVNNELLFSGVTTEIEGSNSVAYLDVDITKNSQMMLEYNIIKGQGMIGFFTIGESGIITGTLIALSEAGDGIIMSFQDTALTDTQNLSVPANDTLIFRWDKDLDKIYILTATRLIYTSPVLTGFVSPIYFASGTATDIGTQVESHYGHFSHKEYTTFPVAPDGWYLHINDDSFSALAESIPEMTELLKNLTGFAGDIIFIDNIPVNISTFTTLEFQLPNVIIGTMALKDINNTAWTKISSSPDFWIAIPEDLEEMRLRFDDLPFI